MRRAVAVLLILTAFSAAVESQRRYYSPYYAAAAAAEAAPTRPDECRSCNPDEDCSPPVDCLAGIVRDVCGCCDVCAKAEFERCDHPGVAAPGRRRSSSSSSTHHGRCGDDLECRLRTDLDGNRDPEAICYCRTEDVVCGSDGVTYDNPCQLRASALAKDRRISIVRKGPCRSAPVLLSTPDHTRDVIGSNIVIMCEAKGYPVPNIEWTWTRVDGQIVYLPSDDFHISVNMRGGPEKWQITGWLQIVGLKKQHEGDYTCIAQNDRGITQASARVNVVDPQGKDRNL